MALESILSDIIIQKEGKVYANSKYNSDKLKEAINKLDEFRRYDLSKLEDLKKNEEMTGDKASDYSSEMLNARRNWRFLTGQADVSLYSTRHYNKIAEEVSDEDKFELALKYCPTTESEDKKYEAVRKTVTESKEELKKISETPNAYTLEEMKDETPFMKRCIALHQEEFLDISKRYAVKNATENISKYGAVKFLDDTFQLLRKTESEAREKVSKLEKEANEEIKKAKEGLNQNEKLTAEKEAQILEKYKTEISKISEEYKNLGFAEALAKETVAYAIDDRNMEKVSELIKLPEKDFYVVPPIAAETSEGRNVRNSDAEESNAEESTESNNRGSERNSTRTGRNNQNKNNNQGSSPQETSNGNQRRTAQNQREDLNERVREVIEDVRQDVERETRERGRPLTESETQDIARRHAPRLEEIRNELNSQNQTPQAAPQAEATAESSDEAPSPEESNSQTQEN